MPDAYHRAIESARREALQQMLRRIRLAAIVLLAAVLAVGVAPVAALLVDALAEATRR